MTKTFVFDSWALIAFIEEEKPADQRVREILEQSRRGQLRTAISIINLGEVFYRVGKMHGERAAESALAGLRMLPMEILPADEEAVLIAGRWKMKHRISYADAFAAAASVACKATLVTGDPELTALAGELNIERLERGG